MQTTDDMNSGNSTNVNLTGAGAGGTGTVAGTLNNPSSYYFLLKTENLETLIVVIDQLSSQLAANQRRIDDLTRFVDSKWRYPKIELPKQSELEFSEGEDPIDTTNGTKNERSNDDANEDSKDGESERNSTEVNEIKEQTFDAQPVDALRYLLNQKYRLDEMEVEPQDGPPRIRQLKADILRLAKIQQSKRSKNRELFKILQEYESFIMEKILPSLRSEVVSLTSLLTKDSNNLSILDRMDDKFSKLGEVYEKYNQNIVSLMVVVNAYHKLLKYLDLNDESYAVLHQQFASIEALRALIPDQSKDIM